MNELKPWHLLIIAAVFVVLFGSKKLPDIARSVGKSLRIFKSEVKALREDDEPKPLEAPAPPPAQTPSAAPTPPAAAVPPGPGGTPDRAELG